LGAHPLDTAVGHSPFAVGALRLPDTTDAGAVAAFVRLGRALVRKCVIDMAPTTLLLVVDGSGYDDITPAMEACRDFARRAYETADFFADYSLRVVPVVLSHI
ncbi:hypothetical protein, partial [Mycobacterium tuberculosis]|uniref:hypothetical protein n=1 Tax=Mycobacterium tuberculosis TaxID=1773 RepID=UPI000A850590